MGLPDAATQKPNAIPDYFDAIRAAQPPERFSVRFLESLGFTSTNDRLFIAILKELAFLDSDGKPTQRYFDYLDRSQSGAVLAEGIREAYSDLFAINTKAHELSGDDLKNKLRTLYRGKKSDLVLSRIAKTFEALAAEADFSTPAVERAKANVAEPLPKDEDNKESKRERRAERTPRGDVSLDSLQYHINIVLPESRDPAVYDAIFKSLREHIG